MERFWHIFVLSTACREKAAVESLTLSPQLKVCDSTAASSEQAVDNTKACAIPSEQAVDNTKTCQNIPGSAPVFQEIGGYVCSNTVCCACQKTSACPSHRWGDLKLRGGTPPPPIGGEGFRSVYRTSGEGGSPPRPNAHFQISDISDQLSPSNLRYIGPIGPESCPYPEDNIGKQKLSKGTSGSGKPLQVSVLPSFVLVASLLLVRCNSHLNSWEEKFNALRPVQYQLAVQLSAPHAKLSL